MINQGESPEQLGELLTIDGTLHKGRDALERSTMVERQRYIGATLPLAIHQAPLQYRSEIHIEICRIPDDVSRVLGPRDVCSATRRVGSPDGFEVGPQWSNL